jgi:hypothetical protein
MSNSGMDNSFNLIKTLLLLTLFFCCFNINAKPSLNLDDKWLSLLNNNAQEQLSFAPDREHSLCNQNACTKPWLPIKNDKINYVALRGTL